MTTTARVTIWEWTAHAGHRIAYRDLPRDFAQATARDLAQRFPASAFYIEPSDTRK